MNEQGQIEQFYQDLREEITFETRADEEGCSREEMFTRLVIRRLEEAGEVENARECRDVRENRAGHTQHKINGYALSEGLDTLDLFVTIYRGTDAVPRVNAQDLRSAVSQATRFAERALKGYVDEVEESAPVFDLALTLAKNWREIVRINLYVLTDGVIVAQELPKAPAIGDGAIVNLHVRDLTYLHRLAEAEGGRIPIEIDFWQDFGQALPCLPFGNGEGDYHSYLTIIPGIVLARIYQEHGARLLEQNVRAFLQFTGKINKGIRETIQQDPAMFFAYNNGIAATAESVEVEQGEDGGHAIRVVRDFQIVNGGQTTASIFHTMRKDRADLSLIAVPVKLTVVNRPDRFTEIVSRISRYANSQNKVTEADLSSNSPFNIELERLSRAIWAPAKEGETLQTHWFFERARGQYKNALDREGHTKKRRSAVEKQNPRNQKFDKEDISRFIFSWDGKPWFVVRGRQKSYTEFIRGIKNTLPDRQYFEDLIARAIAFKTAEQLYGTKNQQHVIGDLRYIVVPYALSWMNDALGRQGQRIDLWRIWKAQTLSPELSLVVRQILEKTDRLVRQLSTQHGGLIGEWAKKEDAWDQLRARDPEINLTLIREDLEAPDRPRPQYAQTETEDLERQLQEERILALPAEIWERLHAWAAPLYPVPPGAQNLLWLVKTRVRSGGRFTDSERRHAIEVLDRALREARDLFTDVDEILDHLSQQQEKRLKQKRQLTAEDAKLLFLWERKNCRLVEADVHFLKAVRDGKRTLSSDMNADRLLKILEKAEGYGYERLQD